MNPAKVVLNWPRLTLLYHAAECLRLSSANSSAWDAIIHPVMREPSNMMRTEDQYNKLFVVRMVEPLHLGSSAATRPIAGSPVNIHLLSKLLERITCKQECL